ncbi:helicase-related protein [uncultured Methanosphaera sp.]|uniref:helicase-related protein n=1 Tax=uncultured Methanosphaera sp. TaxID=262501 RepID=UPI002804E6BE|nr:helicase-related protein [uncultured Methanosphaera sp.]
MDIKNTSFLTNNDGNTVLGRFNQVLLDTEIFDCLVGYFYISGFYKLQENLENVKKIRILVGMGIDSQTFQLIEDSKSTMISTKQFKENINNDIIREMNNSENSIQVEQGARQFIKWLQSGKVEIKAYKERKTHSKLYIMGFPQDDRDEGRVFTGSSNFTQPGLEKNLEFNVELSQKEDILFAQKFFEELWEKSEPITKDFINTLNTKTWLRNDVTPYELYLKFIYEYLYEKIWNDQKEMDLDIIPPEFKYLEYQKDAVLDAYEKVQQHGGVFLSDVVGLGKTYMGALLAQQLKGTTLVIAPPALINEHNPGGWKRVMRDFEVKSIVESKGKLDQIVNKYEHNEYRNVIIDESHVFRNEDTQQYEYLSQICKNKNVILILATPFNNKPADLLSQLKLFQPAHNSTLPNPKVRDLEGYFKKLEKRQKMYDRDENPEEYLDESKSIAQDIRENILQYIMVRRTRDSVKKYYAKDLKKNNMKFPDVKSPIPVYYEFDEYINEIFNKTLKFLTQDLTYAKYIPVSEIYMKNPNTMYLASQKNMANFIKILLIKRLESGSYAFKKSIDNSILKHEQAIKILKEKGEFYTSKDYNYKIFNLVEDGDIDEIEKLLNNDKANKYTRDEFKPQFEEDLNKDLKILYEIKQMWSKIIDYPKKDKIIELLNSEELKDEKIIIFTEFIDTAKELHKILSQKCEGNVKLFTGSSKESERDEVIYNFDDNIPKEQQKNDYRILITTDTLSHGVNLHRSNRVINFDIPWNPTKIMQRVGRIQRLDTKFDEIYIYNFFPTSPIEENINIEFLAKQKIGMFIELLGNDSQLLTDEPIQSYDLFNRINGELEEDKDEIIDDELKYLKMIRDIRDNEPELFKKIEEIPQKIRVGRKTQQDDENTLITLLKLGNYKKILKTQKEKTEEIDFFEAAKTLKATKDEKPQPIPKPYYNYLNHNIQEFEKILKDPEIQRENTRAEKTTLKYINASRNLKKQLTSYDKDFLNKVKELITNGYITKSKINKINKEIKIKIENLNKKEDQINKAYMIIDILRKNINEDDLKIDTKNNLENNKDKQIILSEFLLN